MFRTLGLPHGIALLRVQTPLGRLVLLSDRLSSEERRAAQILAVQRVRMGEAAVVIGELEVASVLAEVEDVPASVTVPIALDDVRQAKEREARRIGSG